MDVLKSLQDTKRYFGVIHSSKCKAYVEQICIVDSCNFSRRNVTQHLKHLEPLHLKPFCPEGGGRGKSKKLLVLVKYVTFRLTPDRVEKTAYFQ